MGEEENALQDIRSSSILEEMLKFRIETGASFFQTYGLVAAVLAGELMQNYKRVLDDRRRSGRGDGRERYYKQIVIDIKNIIIPILNDLFVPVSFKSMVVDPSICKLLEKVRLEDLYLKTGDVIIVYNRMMKEYLLLKESEKKENNSENEKNLSIIQKEKLKECKNKLYEIKEYVERRIEEGRRMRPKKMGW